MSTACNHEWLTRGMPDDHWRECWLCGTQQDSPADDTGLCDGHEDMRPDVVTCDHGFTLCETCRDESACRWCRTEGRLANWRLT